LSLRAGAPLVEMRGRGILFIDDCSALGESPSRQPTNRPNELDTKAAAVKLPWSFAPLLEGTLVSREAYFAEDWDEDQARKKKGTRADRDAGNLSHTGVGSGRFHQVLIPRSPRRDYCLNLPVLSE
jgi:hypothetical protein